MKSWAVPKGPSLDPGVKRLAIQTEDHPLDYGGFEGQIPEGNYGAGEVILWDHGTYSAEGQVPAEKQLAAGELKFILSGQKLHGSFVLVRLKNSKKQNEWLLIKHRDEEARSDWNIEEHGLSVKSGKTPGPPRHPPPPVAGKVFASGVQHLKNASKSPLPRDVRPALASLSEKPFSSADWLFEIKWDGIRSLAFIEDGQTKLVSRSGRSISAEYPEFAGLAKHIRARTAVLDGEIVVLDEQGRSDFQRLQPRFGLTQPSQKMQAQAPVTYYFFDVLHCDGYDLRRVPLLDRKKLLAGMIATTEQLRISDYQIGKGIELFEAALENGLEGLVAKRLDSSYPTGRSTSWLKLKSVREVDAVIGGWTDPRGSREYFGSLLGGLYEKSTLRFIGGVGTGFANDLEKQLFEKLQKLVTDKCPFKPVPETRERAHWVSPKLVARVGYAEWTSEKQLRQPRFLGLQADRDPRDSTFEKEQAAPALAVSPANEKRERSPKPALQKPAFSPPSIVEALQQEKQEQLRLELGGRAVTLTHLNKIYFPQGGYRKRDVLRYYAAVSDYLLPFLKDRPMVLHRYPNGITGNAFYQKEAGPSIPEWIRTVGIFSETKKHEVEYFLIDDLASLLYLTNLGCIEHNPFSAKLDDLEKPDYMFLDLDPTDGTAFKRVVMAARILGEVLQKAKLKFFVKTSGATGMHVFVPIERKYAFDHVRALLEIITRVAVEKEQGLLTRIMRVQDRPRGSIFVDVRQNASAQSLASVFSLRPREGAPASTPVSWNELTPDLKPERWNLASVLDDLPGRAKIWADFFKYRQTLESAIAALEKTHTT